MSSQHNVKRYHAYSEGHYYAPNDERQNAQLDILYETYSTIYMRLKLTGLATIYTLLHLMVSSTLRQ